MKKSKKVPLVSVVIPAYNAEEFINECLDSLIAQSYLNIELQVINDGSSDNTKAIIDQYAGLDSRIQVHYKDNEGVSIARNLGIQMASGDYICFVDADDTVSPYYIEYLISDIQRTGSDISCCGETRTQQALLSYKENSPALTIYNKKSAISQLLYPSSLNNGPFGKLFRTDYVKTTLFDSKISFAEDLKFNYTMISKSQTISLNTLPLYFYRRSITGAMESNFSIKRMSGLKATAYILEDLILSADEDLIIAAKSRHFMEAVFIAVKIDDKIKYGKEYLECLKVIASYKADVLADKKALWSMRLVSLIAVVNIEMAIMSYKVMKKSSALLRKLKVA